MIMILKEIPLTEQPREKLLNLGSEKLSNTELLAILLRTGTKDENVLKVAEKVIYLLEDISDLTTLTLQELTDIKGIGLSKAITILAAVELGKRIVENKEKSLVFSTPEAIFSYFKPRMINLKQETLYGIYLDIRGKVIAIKHLTTGTLTSTLIDPKLIFKWAYKLSASNIILVHNHPSKDSTPSMADLKITAELIKQSKVIQIEIIDHIIIGDDFFSMKRSVKNYKLF